MFNFNKEKNIADNKIENDFLLLVAEYNDLKRELLEIDELVTNSSDIDIIKVWAMDNMGGGVIAKEYLPAIDKMIESFTTSESKSKEIDLIEFKDYYLPQIRKRMEWCRDFKDKINK